MNDNPLFAIPFELRQLNQWVCTKADKNLFQVNGGQAKVNEPNTWNTFNACVNAIGTNNITSVGLVLTDNDPYFIIDLDKTGSEPKRGPVHRSIHDDFDTFSEVSISGTGCHIVGKGSIITDDGKQGFKNKEWGVECYWSRHYLIFTGKIYNDKPIEYRQELLEKLYQSFKSNKNIKVEYNISSNVNYSDEEVIAKICSAINGDRFKELYEQGYPSISDRSSVDIAFMNFMAFHNVGEQQAIRLIMNSKLASDRAIGPAEKRKKFYRADYLPNTYRNAVSNPLATIPPIDFEGFKEALEEKLALNGNHANVAQRLEPSPHKRLDVGSNPTASTSPVSTIIPPPGLLGEIAQYIYETSPLPVPEIALAGAIGLMAGICGKAYNLPASGLNMYVLLLAMTGTGKESMASGISRLVTEVQKSVPVASEFIGPSEIASGQALIKYIAKKSQCFISILGEFGIRLQTLTDKNASAADKNLKRTLLDLFNKSSQGDVVRSYISSDQEKNTTDVQAPAITILGESTPETFYHYLDEEMIADGLLTRFLIIEYKGDRPPLNKSKMGNKPNEALTEKVATLMAHSKKLMSLNNVQMISKTEEAEMISDDFEELARSKINSANKDVIRNLWNRAHVKAIKLAGLVAIGENYVNPVISAHNLRWAISMVTDDIKSLSSKFEEGGIGRPSIENRQYKEVKRIMIEYVTRPYNPKSKMPEHLHTARVIPKSYISRKLSATSAFQENGTFALKRAIQNLVDDGFIEQVDKVTLVKLNTGFESYMIKDMSDLDLN